MRVTVQIYTVFCYDMKTICILVCISQILVVYCVKFAFYERMIFPISRASLIFKEKGSDFFRNNPAKQ